MSAREEIMQPLRADPGKGDTAARRAAAEAAIRQPVRGPQLRLNGDLATMEVAFALPRAANFIAGPRGPAISNKPSSSAPMGHAGYT